MLSNGSGEALGTAYQYWDGCTRQHWSCVSSCCSPAHKGVNRTSYSSLGLGYQGDGGWYIIGGLLMWPRCSGRSRPGRE